MEWASNPTFASVELSESMDVDITITAEAGIETFVVSVNSSVLSPAISEITSDHSSDMDLIGDTALATMLDALTGGGIPTGENLYGKTEVHLDISSLVPLILTLSPENGTDHSFVLKVSDNEGQTLTKTLTFHYTGESSVSVSDIDLWANSASVNVVATEAVASPAVYFGKKGSDDFVQLAADSDGKYLISTEYEKTVNEGGLEVYVPKDGTGVYAGNTYVVELRDGGNVVASTEFTAESGDVIPNGDMSGWSTSTSGFAIPNAEGDDAFWASGNNSFTKTLCAQDDGMAKLSSTVVLSTVFACGNMYSGEFAQSGISGVASFGQAYTWTARPKAFRVNVKASVGNIEKVGSIDPDKEALEAGPAVDKARIYAVVVDWSARHGVKSGLGVKLEEVNSWDPITMTSVEEGNILGYASAYIEESSEDVYTLEIPFEWYDTVTLPSAEYSLVISCAASSRGDYLTGCSTNVLWVDNFEWVY